MSTASDQITEYLSVGGLFNPEIMNQTQHEAVRDTLIKARDDIQSLERENAALRDALDNAIVLLRRWNKNDVTDDVVVETRKTIHAVLKEAQP